MTCATLAFITPTQPPAWKRWLLFSPLARIVIFVLLMLAFGLVGHFALGLAGYHAATASPLSHGLVQLLMRGGIPLLAYLALVRWVERRSVRELAPRRLLPDGLIGLLSGVVLFSAVVAVLWTLGSYRVVGFNPGAHWLGALLMVGLGAGIGEEVMFRGVLFRIVEEGMGTWAALIISALFFGAVHMGNPGATVWSSAAIAIEAGLLFGLIYHVTRSLPLCMGLHASWNFMQGTVYGIPVSGTRADGWLVSQRSGPDWLSGGVFGAEASVVALFLCSLVSLVLLRMAWRSRSLAPLRRPLPSPITDG